jgi:DNA-binding ferritin-like protein
MSNEDSKSYKDNANEPATETSTTKETIVISPSNTTYKIHDQNSSVEQEDEEQDESISAMARETGQSFKGFIVTLGKKAMAITDEKTTETTNESIDIGAKRDSQSIQTLGANVEKAITVFEDTITDIRKESYDEQANILTGYKKLIEEQINVINARLSMVKKFKQAD